MKKCILFLALASFSLAGFAQNNKGSKTTPKTDPKATNQPAATTTTNPPANQSQPQQPQVDPIIAHYLKKYNAAMQFNDALIAREALLDLIVEMPSNDSLILNLAVMYFESRQYASTILVSQTLLARNAKNATALELAAASFESLNIFDKALANYESLYLVNNNYATLYKMAFLQYQLKRYQECSASTDILLSKKEVEELKVTYPISEKETKEFPIRVAILNLKGMVAAEGNDKVNAKKFYDQALALAPDFVQAKENLAKLK